MLLWPVELVGSVQNPMQLHEFPFDADVIELHGFARSTFAGHSTTSPRSSSQCHTFS